MSHTAAISNNDGNLLFNEATGASSFHILDDLNFYDTDSGKWYRTVFDIEQSFYASKFYYIPSIETIPIYEDSSIPFEQTQISFTPAQMDMDILETKPQLVGLLDGSIKAIWSHYYEPDF